VTSGVCNRHLDLIIATHRFP
jgi:hypothetical protein